MGWGLWAISLVGSHLCARGQFTAHMGFMTNTCGPNNEMTFSFHLMNAYQKKNSLHPNSQTKEHSLSWQARL
jgi:hypothetical protein